MKWVLITWALLFALPLSAAQDRWPALYDVTGVAPDDVLNIRDAPSASAAIIGGLGPDSADVELIRPDDSGKWALVNSGERTGWVSLSFLRRQPGQWVGSLPRSTACFGTEPFWSYTVRGKDVIYESLEIGAMAGRLSHVEQSQNTPGRHVTFTDFGAESGADPGSSVALFSNEICSDGMSDRAYGYRIDLLLQGIDSATFQSGCCRLVP